MKKLLFLIITIQITLFAKPFIPLQSGDTIEGHVNYLEKQYYELKVYKEQTVTIKLTNLVADIDIYLGINNKPKIRSNDCYSSNGNTENEECILTIPAPDAGKSTSVIVMVYGFKESTYKLKVISKDGAEDLPTLSDTPIASQVKKGEGKQYKFLGKKGETYTTTLSNLSADADLRVSIGRRAGLRTFTCKSINGGTNTDECAVTLKEDAPVYVQVYGYKKANYKISMKEKNNQNQLLITKAKQHCLNKDNSNDLVLCSNEKETVYILKNDINYQSGVTHHALYRVIITSGNEAVTLLRERSKPTWQHPHTNEYFIKKLEDTLMYGTYTRSDEADERGSFNFQYKEKTLLSFRYLERDGYLRKKYTSEEGNRLHIEYNDRIYSDYGRKCSELYNISNPAEPKLINKECSPLYP